eukprot:CAMPEP_0173309322 /NCGR_PEP_ID=MMETSP1143-20121109/22264_1 /TAXON_ID=483371 /ORGANISM="non described non described, Strain CCMP2298" /LENGTH=161 /DNA_ID=CAMNT_0014250897 /DNA_START=160 /DNA_END=642 /DNA_ORIENTATION=+
MKRARAEAEKTCGICFEEDLHPDCSVQFTCGCICVLHNKCAVRRLASQAESYHEGMKCIYCRKVGSKFVLQGIGRVRELERELLKSAQLFLTKQLTVPGKQQAKSEGQFAKCILLYWWLGYTYEGGLNKTTGKTDENPEGYPELNTNTPLWQLESELARVE